MHIVYSALRAGKASLKNKQQQTELQERLDAYYKTCDKFREEITEIQKYFPGWTPAFEAKG